LFRLRAWVFLLLPLWLTFGGWWPLSNIFDPFSSASVVLMFFFFLQQNWLFSLVLLFLAQFDDTAVMFCRLSVGMSNVKMAHSPDPYNAAQWRESHACSGTLPSSITTGGFLSFWETNKVLD